KRYAPDLRPLSQSVLHVPHVLCARRGHREARRADCLSDRGARSAEPRAGRGAARGRGPAANLYLTYFLARKLEGAPIVGIATEWKTTNKGNGMFVLTDGPIQTPEDLAGRRIASHQKVPHVIHRYLLKHRFGVDETSLQWAAHPQEELLEVLKSG